MPSFDHPVLLLVAGLACVAAAFPVARFFFDDFDTFKEEFGVARDWEQGLWLLGFFPSSPLAYAKVIGFVGTLVIVFLAVYSLAQRLAVP